jgi:hypothetical protein
MKNWRSSVTTQNIWFLGMAGVRTAETLLVWASAFLDGANFHPKAAIHTVFQPLFRMLHGLIWDRDNKSVISD